MAEHYIANRFSRILVSTAVLALSTSCSWLSPYRMDISQGNYVTEDMVARLETGMTKEQVRYILGTSLLVDAFHPNRWNYVYLFHQGGAKLADDTRYRIVVVFDDAGRLERIEKPENLPSAIPAVMFRLDPAVKTDKKDTKGTPQLPGNAEQKVSGAVELLPDAEKRVAPDSTPATAVAPSSEPLTAPEPESTRALPRFGSESQMPVLPGMGNKTKRKIDALPTEEEVRAEIDSMQGF